MKNLFDLENVDDLPDNVKNSLERKPMKQRETKLESEVMSLFKLKGELSLKEISVGMFRKYEKEMTIAAISALGGRLIKKGRLIRGEKKGVYIAMSDAFGAEVE